jgi:hypothetical protein
LPKCFTRYLGVHVAHALDQLPEESKNLSFFDSFFDEIGECPIGTKLNKDIDAFVYLLEAVESHDVGVNEGGQGFECFNLTFISLSLHGFDCDDLVLLG